MKIGIRSDANTKESLTEDEAIRRLSLDTQSVRELVGSYGSASADISVYS